MKQKSFMVIDKITKIDMGTKNKPPTITFIIQHPNYFSDEAKQEITNFLDKLLQQQIGGNTKIAGLKLVWNEED